MTPQEDKHVLKYMENVIKEAVAVMLVEAQNKGCSSATRRDITRVMIKGMFQMGIQSTVGVALAEDINASWKDAANTAFREAFVACEAQAERTAETIRKERDKS